MQSTQTTPTVRSGVAAGFITLMVAMGIGRFLYTPLLPAMLTEYGLRPDQAGLLASFNYIGYLVGAFSAGPLCHRFREYPVLAAGLLLSCATSAATGLYTPFVPLAAARLVSGTASALAFVAVSGLVLRIIARDNRENLAGLYYGGVGGGIVLTGLVSRPVARAVGAAATWEIFAGLSLLLSGIALLLLFRHREPQGAVAQGKKAPLPRQGAFLRLVASYGCEGFGYIITGTFMVAAAQATVGPAGAQFAWIVAGCTALPSAFIWSSAAGAARLSWWPPTCCRRSASSSPPSSPARWRSWRERCSSVPPSWGS